MVRPTPPLACSMRPTYLVCTESVAPRGGRPGFENRPVPSGKIGSRIGGVHAKVPHLEPGAHGAVHPGRGGLQQHRARHSAGLHRQLHARVLLDRHGGRAVPGSWHHGIGDAHGYTISITFPAGTLASNDSTIVDHGTYTATGTATSGTWTQQSTDDLTLQYSGTYEFNGTTGDLTLDTTAQGVRTVVVLRKT
jgi:hypothetical protein